MCFNKSKSSSASSSSSVNRDERIALDNGSDAVVLKEIVAGNIGHNANLAVSLNVTDASSEVLAVHDNFLTGALGIVDGAMTNAGNLVAGTLESLLGFAKDNADRSTQFAASTQAAYAAAVRDDMTNDLTQVLEQGMKTLLIGAALYVALQVLK